VCVSFTHSNAAAFVGTNRLDNGRSRHDSHRPIDSIRAYLGSSPAWPFHCRAILVVFGNDFLVFPLGWNLGQQISPDIRTSLSCHAAPMDSIM
jgi:hypothetical protein